VPGILHGKIEGMTQNTNWQETKHGLYKQFVFHDFREAWAFMERVAAAAEQMQHHPRWQNEWNAVDIWLSTHDAGMQITDKDRVMANTIDTLVEKTQNVSTESNVDKKSTILTEAKLYTDGGSRGNPGPSASGFVLLDMEDRVLVSKGIYLGVTTNNQAEYQALKSGMEEALSRGVQRLHVFMDSMLVVNQMKGIFKVKNRDLWPIHDAIKQAVGRFKHVDFTHVPRELNKLADTEVNKALDAQLEQ
jgi:ribonuclease HI/pterin-4a-carbinolamine dehydratase